MSYFMVHLKIAEEFLARTNAVRDIGAFYIGCLAPDAIMFRPGRLRSEKSLTHFCVGDQTWGYHTNYADWTLSLQENIKCLAGQVDDDFLLGYMTHIYTDIQNTEQLWTPNRLSPKAGHLETFHRDCAEIDSRIMAGLKDKALIWSVLRKPKDYLLPGCVEAGDMDLLSAAFFRMYGKRTANRRYAFSAVTETEMRTFINNTVGPLTARYESFRAL